MQSLNCVRKYLSLFIAFAGLPLLTFTLSSHTKALAWVQHRKPKVVGENHCTGGAG